MKMTIPTIREALRKRSWKFKDEKFKDEVLEALIYIKKTTFYDWEKESCRELISEISEIEPGDIPKRSLERISVEFKDTGVYIEVNDWANGLLKRIEQEAYRITLLKTNGNREKASKILGVSIRTLRNKLHDFGGRTVVMNE
jgi:DNA-binding protein Fis